MSKLNYEISHTLFANGFGLVSDIVSENLYEYQYFNGTYYIFFGCSDLCVCAIYEDGTLHKLQGATADEVVAYFTKQNAETKAETVQTPHQLKMQLIGNLQQALLDLDFYFYQCNLDEMYHDKLNCTVWFDINCITVQHGKHDRTDITYDITDVHGAMFGAVSKHLQEKQ